MIFSYQLAIKRVFLLLICGTSIFFANNREKAINQANLIQLELFHFNNIEYIDLHAFTTSHDIYIKYYETKDKLELNINDSKIYISPQTSFCKINDKIYHLTHPIIKKNTTILIPALEFYQSIKNDKLPLRIIKKEPKAIYVAQNIFNITDIKFSQKQNGTLITLQTTRQFYAEEISNSISSSKWLNITIINGLLDSMKLNQKTLQAPISKIRTIQLKESAQISLLLDDNIEDVDFDIQKNEIHFLLRNAIAENAKKIIEIKQKWFIDTIVIDAGHGGKDPGAIGFNNVLEKNITLEIALQLGKLIKNNLGLNVIYTREKDVFVPLWKRTKLANEAKGKLFISIHANSAPKSPHIKGFETYLLRPGKTGQAIDVAKRENAVIDLEIKQQKYQDINEHFILAAMAQNSFVKESEDFAVLIQRNMQKSLKTASKNRGVKQAGFHVLVGASMPNVLIETGFLSNKTEAQNLSKSYYQNKIATAIYEAIVDFKIRHEKPLISQ